MVLKIGNVVTLDTQHEGMVIGVTFALSGRVLYKLLMLTNDKNFDITEVSASRIDAVFVGHEEDYQVLPAVDFLGLLPGHEVMIINTPHTGIIVSLSYDKNGNRSALLFLQTQQRFSSHPLSEITFHSLGIHPELTEKDGIDCQVNLGDKVTCMLSRITGIVSGIEDGDSVKAVTIQYLAMNECVSEFTSYSTLIEFTDKRR